MKKDGWGTQPPSKSYIWRERKRDRKVQRCRQTTNDILHSLTLNISSLCMNNLLSCLLVGKAEFTKKHLPLHTRAPCCFPFVLLRPQPKSLFSCWCSFIFVCCFCLQFSPFTFYFVERMHSAAFIVFSYQQNVFFRFKKLILFTPLFGVSFAETKASVKQKVSMWYRRGLVLPLNN